MPELRGLDLDSVLHASVGGRGRDKEEDGREVDGETEGGGLGARGMVIGWEEGQRRTWKGKPGRKGMIWDRGTEGTF